MLPKNLGGQGHPLQHNCAMRCRRVVNRLFLPYDEQHQSTLTMTGGSFTTFRHVLRAPRGVCGYSPCPTEEIKQKYIKVMKIIIVTGKRRGNWLLAGFPKIISNHNLKKEKEF